MKILFVPVKTSFLTFETMADAKLTAGNILTEQNLILSKHLEREVIFDAYLPLHIAENATIGLLLINDGQDLPKMHFDHLLDGLIQSSQMEPLICIGIHCGEDRKMEYGTVSEKKTTKAAVQKLLLIPGLFLKNCSQSSAENTK